MKCKLIQKHFLHGTQEFELMDDLVKVRINSFLTGKKELDIVLAVLNPEPMITRSRLHFHSRVKCGPLISLYLNKPDEAEFNTFVEAVKAKAKLAYDAFTGQKN